MLVVLQPISGFAIDDSHPDGRGGLPELRQDIRPADIRGAELRKENSLECCDLGIGQALVLCQGMVTPGRALPSLGGGGNRVRCGGWGKRAAVLPRQRLGGLIAMERAQSLRMDAEAAKNVDAAVTADLLISIFVPGGPLHDGAAIIRGDRIVAAGAFLPLTTSADPKFAHGTRHRAAIGLSEDSDALILIISEENGSIAAATEGVLHEHLDRDQLLQLMTEKLRATRK